MVFRGMNAAASLKLIYPKCRQMAAFLPSQFAAAILRPTHCPVSCSCDLMPLKQLRPAAVEFCGPGHRGGCRDHRGYSGRADGDLHRDSAGDLFQYDLSDEGEQY